MPNIPVLPFDELAFHPEKLESLEIVTGLSRSDKHMRLRWFCRELEAALPLCKHNQNVENLTLSLNIPVNSKIQELFRIYTEPLFRIGKKFNLYNEFRAVLKRKI